MQLKWIESGAVEMRDIDKTWYLNIYMTDFFFLITIIKQYFSVF